MNKPPAQFALSGDLLIKELDNKLLGMSPNEWTPTKYAKARQDIIAQFLSDFALHVAAFVIGESTLSKKAREEIREHIISKIPDMTAWRYDKEATHD